MLKNYLKIALRNLSRHKSSSSINIFGLSVGLACSFLILLYVQHERSYDRFHEKADRIYRLTLESTYASSPAHFAAVSKFWGPALRTAFPQVISTVRFVRWSKSFVAHQDRRFHEDRFFFADSTVFEVFSFPLIKGDPQTALIRPGTVVLTEETARRYFGDVDPIGQTLVLESKSDEFSPVFEVTGVMKTPPENTHLKFDFLASFSTIEPLDIKASVFYTYVLLPPDHSPSAVEAQFPPFLKAILSRELSPPSLGEEVASRSKLHLQPLTSIHLHSNLSEELEPGGNVAYLYTLSIAALFILLTACINFTSLAVARSAQRAREVGVRKVLGANRWQLARQFLAEAFLHALAAFLLAAVLARLVLPVFNSLSGKQLSLTFFDDGQVVAGFTLLALLVGCLSGFYPALFLSRFQAAEVIKGSVKLGNRRAPQLLRRGLVVVQFALSTFLLIGIGVVRSQTDYLMSKDLGFEEEALVVLSSLPQEVKGSFEAVKGEILSAPGVLSASAASTVPVPGNDAFWQVWAHGEGVPLEEAVLMKLIGADHDLIETLGMRLKAGRDFSEAHPTDAESGFILNETAVKKLGWEDPIGKTFKTQFYAEDGGAIWKEGRIIGIVEDIHFQSLHEQVDPYIFAIAPHMMDYFLVRIDTRNMPETLARLEERWEKATAGYPLDYFFMDDRLEELYQAEMRVEALLRVFSLLALFIACLGLFGVVSVTAVQRTKEIGIRKVLGASVANIVSLLSKELLGLVLIAFAVAIPFAYLVMDQWLDGFAYRIEIPARVFLLAGLVVLLLAFVTVSYQSMKAALADPVNSLRYE